MPTVLDSLPEFRTGNFAWTNRDLTFACNSGYETLIRPVRLSRGSSTSNLEQILARTDEELERLAKKCGAIVLPHAWGIIKLGDQELGLFQEEPHYITYTHPELDKDTILGAEVETIKPNFGSDSLEAGQQIHKGLNSYRGLINRVVSTGRGLLLDAARPDQFTYGTTRSISRPSAILHDIEPILY